MTSYRSFYENLNDRTSFHESNKLFGRHGETARNGLRNTLIEFVSLKIISYGHSLIYFSMTIVPTEMCYKLRCIHKKIGILWRRTLTKLQKIELINVSIDNRRDPTCFGEDADLKNHKKFYVALICLSIQMSGLEIKIEKYLSSYLKFCSRKFYFSKQVLFACFQTMNMGFLT